MAVDIYFHQLLLRNLSEKKMGSDSASLLITTYTHNTHAIYLSPSSFVCLISLAFLNIT